MNYQTKKISGTEIEISGEIEAADFDVYYQKTFKEISENAEIPGFRKGQAPENILKERVGEHYILEQAAEAAINETWPKILEEKVGEGLEIIGRPQISITKIAKNNPLGFKIIVFILPEIKLGDYKKISRETMSRTPEIAAENATENKETEKIKERDKKRIEAMDKIAEDSAIEIPDILVEAEKEKMILELKAGIENTGMKWEDYLKHLKKTEDDLKKDWQDTALKRARYGLILRAIANKENIQVFEEEIKQKIEQILKTVSLEEQKKLDQNRLKDYAYAIIRNEKTFQILENA
ncbi:MAG: trigger factor [Patescibacteria group bacterium]